LRLKVIDQRFHEKKNSEYKNQDLSTEWRQWSVFAYPRRLVSHRGIYSERNRSTPKPQYQAASPVAWNTKGRAVRFNSGQLREVDYGVKIQAREGQELGDAERCRLYGAN